MSSVTSLGIRGTRQKSSEPCPAPKWQTPDNAHRNVPMSEEEILVGVGDASLDAVSVTGGGKELSLVW